MSRRRGFTLIELLVVIAIIGILAALVYANFAGARPKARDAQRKSDLRNLQTALDVYANDNGSYPDSVSIGCLDEVLSPCIDSSVLGSTYITKVPTDPKDGSQYGYNRSGSNHAYRLRARLENASDSEREVDGYMHRCGGNSSEYLDEGWEHC